MYNLLVPVWSMERVSRDWIRGILVKLYKKGDALNCDNWREINLTSVLREKQHGLRPGRSCSELIFILRLMVEESRE